MNIAINEVDIEKLVLKEQMDFLNFVISKFNLSENEDFYKYIKENCEIENNKALFEFMNNELYAWLKSERLKSWKYYFGENIKSAKKNGVTIDIEFFILTYKVLNLVCYENNIYSKDKDQYKDIFEKCVR